MADKQDLDLIETKVSSEDIFDGALLHVKLDTVKLPNGNKATRELDQTSGGIIGYSHPAGRTDCARAPVPLSDRQGNAGGSCWQAGFAG